MPPEIILSERGKPSPDKKVIYNIALLGKVLF